MALDYNGGGHIYEQRGVTDTQSHMLQFDSRAMWRTGVLQIRDSASYLPEGSFGSLGAGVGGTGAFGSGLGGVGSVLGGMGGNRFNFFGAGTFGALGLAARVHNTSIIDIRQSLSPRSTFTLAGSYSFIHFTHSTGGLFLDSRLVSGQAGYNRALTRRDQIAMSYGFQRFAFPRTGGGSFESHVLHLLYGHQISGRLDLAFGGGPQLITLKSPLQGGSRRISASARASLSYRFPKTSVSLSYNRFQSSGSGFFAGAETDTARLTATRPLGRRWQIAGDLGYSRNHRTLTVTSGVSANTYQYGYGSARITRLLTRSLHGFMTYQYNDLIFDSSFCGTSGACSHKSNRSVLGVGLTWHPAAIRLD